MGEPETVEVMKRSVSGRKLHPARVLALASTEPDRVYLASDIAKMIVVNSKQEYEDHRCAIHRWLSGLVDEGRVRQYKAWLGKSIHAHLENGDRDNARIHFGLSYAEIGMKPPPGFTPQTRPAIMRKLLPREFEMLQNLGYKTAYALAAPDLAPDPPQEPKVHGDAGDLSQNVDETRQIGGTLRNARETSREVEPLPSSLEGGSATGHSAPPEQSPDTKQLEASLHELARKFMRHKEGILDEVQQIMRSQAMLLRHRVARSQALDPEETQETQRVMDSCVNLIDMAKQPLPTLLSVDSATGSAA